MRAIDILKLPPRVKVLEALGSIADGRIEILNDKKARVKSSLGDRVYTVCVDVEKGIAYSDDNGTKYRKYIGYPIIALLMIKGLLPFNERIAKALSGIPWKSINERMKSYKLVEQYVKLRVKSRGIEPKEVDDYISKVLSELSKIKLIYSDVCLK